MGPSLGRYSEERISQGMTKGIRILALVTDTFGGYGGIAQFNRDLQTALSNSEAVARITVLPRLNGGDPGARTPVKVAQEQPRCGRAAYTLAAARIALAQGPFDVVFCGHIYHAPLAAALCRLMGARLWLQTHGVDAWQPPNAMVRTAVDLADLVTTVSHYTRTRMLAWSRLAPERLRVLPNTVRAMFLPGPGDPALIARFGLTGRKIILTVSRLNQVDADKGHDRVIKALAQVRRAEPSAHYLIVGDGDGRLALEALAVAHGQGDAVTFAGRLSDAEVLSLYRSADVFAMPSTKEGFGIVFVEAAACGLPVIAGNQDGSVDALGDGAFGRLINPHSETELVSALVETLRQGRASSEERAAKVTERFSRSHFTREVHSLLRTLSA